MEIKRHTMAYVSEEGRRRIVNEWPEAPLHGPDRAAVARILLGAGDCPIPGVARREELAPREGMLPVGFSSPNVGPEGRIRVPAFVRPEEIERLITPYELLRTGTSSGLGRRETPALKALEDMREEAPQSGVIMGVWGSAAMELATGLPFTHEGSDLDLLIRPAPLDALCSFYHSMLLIEDLRQIRIDAELDLLSGFGVSLKELLMPTTTKTVLGKSMQAVDLLKKADILAQLPANAA